MKAKHLILMYKGPDLACHSPIELGFFGFDPKSPAELSLALKHIQIELEKARLRPTEGGEYYLVATCNTNL